MSWGMEVCADSSCSQAKSMVHCKAARISTHDAVDGLCTYGSVSAPTCFTMSVMLIGKSACKAALTPRWVLVRLAKHCMADTAAGQSV